MKTTIGRQLKEYSITEFHLIEASKLAVPSFTNFRQRAARADVRVQGYDSIRGGR